MQELAKKHQGSADPSYSLSENEHVPSVPSVLLALEPWGLMRLSLRLSEMTF